MAAARSSSVMPSPSSTSGCVARSSVCAYTSDMELPNRVLRSLLTVILAGARGFAADEQAELPPAAKIQVDYQGRIEPIFRSHCYGCHGPNQQTNGLRLDQGEAALKGGYSGPSFVAGDSAASKLILRTASKKANSGCLPRARHVPKRDRAVASMDRSRGKMAKQRAPRPFVAVLGKTKPLVFSTRGQDRSSRRSNRQWVRNPIDAFILAKLESNEVAPSPEADKRTMIRRVSLDLTGFRRRREEVAAFLSDNRPDAYERLVDRLLDSPHYRREMGASLAGPGALRRERRVRKGSARPHAWR